MAAATAGGADLAMGFALAGVSNMCAAALTNPIDVVKVKMQLEQNAGHGWLSRGYAIAKKEGATSLFIRGLAPSLFREGVYSGIRLGAYEPIRKQMIAAGMGEEAATTKIAAAMASGGMGAMIGAPTELIKIKMQANGWSKSGKVFTSPVCCFKYVARTEGMRGLFCGAGAFVQRSSILTGTQIPAYEEAKHAIKRAGLLGEGTALHLASSMIAGLAATITCSPFDFLKTRMMQEGARYDYSTWKCLVQTVKSEGPFALYKGFIPNWLRLGPHSIVTFFAYEQLRKAVGWNPV